jgi:tRNA (guanine10-N2)-dimethyltransferase
MQSLLVLGRQPELGLAELESLYGASRIRLVGQNVAVIDVDPCLLAFDRLGGSIKFCKILTTLDTTHWKQLERFLVQASPAHSQDMPAGKMLLGLSVIGLDTNVRQINATGLSIKKAVRATGRPVRLVPNKEKELNSAQVLHNKLTGQNGWELVLIKDGAKTIIAQTVKVQDIDSYTRRDRGRPKRDARVGMLPPKLAQTLINLASGPIPEDKLESICDIPADKPIPPKILGQTVLDPFCGTGVVLQEALLMGYGAYGSDADQRMVDYTEHNVKEWLPTWYDHSLPVHIEKGDATNHPWKQPFDLVACETYLGRPFTAAPSSEVLAQTIADCQLIIKKFLQNIADQIEPGARLCLAVPAWQTSPGKFRHLPLIDSLSDLGYNRVKFEHVRDEKLLYYRADQIVTRELLVITRK